MDSSSAQFQPLPQAALPPATAVSNTIQNKIEQPIIDGTLDVSLLSENVGGSTFPLLINF